MEFQLYIVQVPCQNFIKLYFRGFFAFLFLYFSAAKGLWRGIPLGWQDLPRPSKLFRHSGNLVARNEIRPCKPGKVVIIRNKLSYLTTFYLF